MSWFASSMAVGIVVGDEEAGPKAVLRSCPERTKNPQRSTYVAINAYP